MTDTEKKYLHEQIFKIQTYKTINQNEIINFINDINYETQRPRIFKSA